MSEFISATEIATQTAKTVEASGGIGTLGINVKIFLAQLVNFLIVLLVLWKWAYTPIVRLLDQRSEKIEKSMKQTEEIAKRLKSVEKEQTRILNEAKSGAALILENAHTDSETRRKELLEKAKQEVQRVIIQGKEQLQLEKTTMIREAKTELIEIAILAATKILKERVNEKTSQKFAQEVVEKMSYRHHTMKQDSETRENLIERSFGA